MSAQENPVHRFADCELDVRERRLLVHGQPVTLTPKVFDTLVLLVERAGHVVSKDELMTALWPRGFVHESNLTKHIWLIRRALGDGEDESRYIETVPKLGYRFVAPVQRIVRVATAIEDVAPESEAAQAMAGASIASADIPPAEVATSTDHEWIAGRDAERRRGDHPAGANSAPVNIPATPRRGKLWPIAIGIALIALLVGPLWWRSPRVAPASGTQPSDPGAMAIVDFNNL
ncbi:MAG TPA: transcriptional regulator, partial [Rhodanobacteraceae bacterium]|nr:transcriptional regulator [Rhodanobacteraceae bacterium]